MTNTIIGKCSVMVTIAGCRLKNIRSCIVKIQLFNGRNETLSIYSLTEKKLAGGSETKNTAKALGEGGAGARTLPLDCGPENMEETKRAAAPATRLRRRRRQAVQRAADWRWR